jgi:Restriction endonuclease BglII
MTILGKYSFANGQEQVVRKYPALFKQIEEAVKSVDASKCLVKESKEKTMMGKLLYSPAALNREFEKYLYPRGWKHAKEQCQYSPDYYVNGYQPEEKKVYPYRDMDFVKDKLGVEVQFGKYSFMVYNVCAKMTIFRNLGHIDTGIEIVPIKELAAQMSTGVSYFEQFVWDLEKRGVSNIDVPALIIGIGL